MQPSPELADMLRKGGYVIVMRHTSSPREAPAKPNADNKKAERQLDDEGRKTATAFGNTLRALKIPIGTVISSPTYRALETVRYAKLGTPQIAEELGDNGQSMQGGTQAQSRWLQQKVADFPKGTNVLMVTHLPNLTGAFFQLANGVEDGEAMIFGPGTQEGRSVVVARVKLADWEKMK